ncbi:MAG: FlgD immunoglobulin-like domain containing protein [bacterium]
MSLSAGRQNAGSHTVSWDGRDERGQALASGIYPYRLMAGGQVQVRRMVAVQ